MSIRIRNALRLAIGIAALYPLLFSAAAAIAADGQDVVLKGDARCTMCHSPSGAPELFGIGRTKHGTRADGRTPTCTSCHGESKGHAEPQGEQAKPDITFKRKGPTPASVQNQACLGCHDKDPERHLWAGSAHDVRNVTCTSCHNVHSGHDKVRDKSSQPEVCYTCHANQRVKANKPSHHPVVEGQMTCSDCHNTHGSAGPALLKRDSVVDTCYTCHMEKRGPFVRGHQPVNEDCAICHDVHGTTAQNLLKTRQPFLCQTCHTPHGPASPSVSRGGNAQPGWWNGSSITQGRGCTSCHTEIHGSNNPSLLNPAPQRLFR